LMADENTSATDVPVVDLSKTCFMLAMSLSRLLGFLDFWISGFLDFCAASCERARCRTSQVRRV
jgi:hypothetical protein